MSLKRKIRGLTGKILVTAMGLSLFAPLAMAANSLIQNVTISPTPFFSNVPGQNSIIDIQYDYNTGGYPTGAVTEEIQDAFDNTVYNFGPVGPDDLQTGHYELQWDGKCNVTYLNAPCTDGEYVPDGKYVVYINSHTATPPDATYISTPIDVAQTVAPEVTLTAQPASVYYKNSGDYTVNYNLARNSGDNWIVRLKIKSASSSDEDTIAEIKSTDGDMTMSWDGKFNGTAANVGSYSYDLWATASVNGFSVESNHVTGNFAISNPSTSTATVTNLTATPTPYDPDNGLLNVGYTLSNSSGAANITAAIYSSTNLNTALKTWALTNQSNGSNTLTWDGKDALNNKVPEGSYVFKVGGYDGSSVITTQEFDFSVTSTPPVANCAGFKDVSPTDPDCPGITYVKSTGAMTGNPDGTFAPHGLLQRDQIMKIVLETFNKFDQQIDYCSGASPFPDVTENAWSFQYVCRAKALAITTGYLSGPDKGFYRPARSVNRVEFLALVLRNLTETMPAVTTASYDDVALNQWFTGYAKYAYDNALFNHPNLFPTNFMTRVEVARVLFKLHQLGKI